MNIIREIRRFKKKSIRKKIRLLSLFLILMIIATYAWFTGASSTDITGLEANVESWDIQYVVNNDEIDDEQLLDEEFIMEFGNIYPGINDYSKTVKVYNMGTKPSQIYVIITSIKLFDVELLNTLDVDNAIQYSDDGQTVQMFESDDYPFSIGYTYDKKIIQGQYNSSADTSAKAELKFTVDWEYEENQDELDTEFGKKAYEFYQTHEKDAIALEIHIKVTAYSMLDITMVN